MPRHREMLELGLSNETSENYGYTLLFYSNESQPIPAEVCFQCSSNTDLLYLTFRTKQHHIQVLFCSILLGSYWTDHLFGEMCSVFNGITDRFKGVILKNGDDYL